MSRHIHLDPVGGISGDMFLAAMLDAFPGAEAGLRADLSAVGLDSLVTLDVTRVRVGGLAACHARVETATDAPPSRHWRDIRARIEASAVRPAVKAEALAIFGLLAEAEAACHAVSVEEVHFHELADWDSLADIVGAASLIVQSGATAWSCAPVPPGAGRVKTAHGLMPLPAPAAARLLEGFALRPDGIEGERVTPTGAAILRRLVRAPGTLPPAGRLDGTGTGAGTRRFEGVPNILRVTLTETAAGIAQDRVAELAFEIDDMTPEELSVALDRLRAADGMLDAGFALRMGKKGRAQFAVRLLCRPEAAETLAELAFAETSTLGIRLAETPRRLLRREPRAGLPRTKAAARPGGTTTKVESDDLAGIPTLRARRRAAAMAEGLLEGRDE